MRPLIALLVVIAVLAGTWLVVRPGGDEDGREGSSAENAERPAVPSIRIAGLRNSPLIGLSDNRPETILDPRFGKSGIKRIRVQVPYDDIVNGGIRVRYLDHWFGIAKRHGIEPLVAFYRSVRSRHLLPSAATYRRNFRLFRKRYPWVRHFSTWDEANFPAAQPTGDEPRRTAEYYRAARRECSGGRCIVLTAGFRADGSAHSAWWLDEFNRHIGRGPHTWGLVAHPDVNRFQDLYTRDFLARTQGPVWVTEVGAVNFFGRGLPPSISRQTRAMRYMMSDYPRVSRRIRRMYIYHWRAAPGNDLFDSALLSVAGKPRPAYRIFFEALGRRAP